VICANKVLREVASVAFLLCAGAFARSADDPHLQDSESYRHIVTTEPHLLNRPPRRDNISDDEVREVQAAALEVYPDFIVVISGVTEGCECEEGSHCTAQVGLALNRDNKTRSLVLSKIDGHWKIGAVQSWWLQYNATHTGSPGSSSEDAWRAWQQKERHLLESYPACPLPAANWTLLRDDRFGSTFIDMSSMEKSGVVRRVNVKHMFAPTTFRSSFTPRFSIAFEAFDCKDRRERTDKLMFYFTDGTARQMTVKDPVLWDPVTPNTISAGDLELVCSWKGKAQP
jgi:hypothetical protein